MDFVDFRCVVKLDFTQDVVVCLATTFHLFTKTQRPLTRKKKNDMQNIPDTFDAEVRHKTAEEMTNAIHGITILISKTTVCYIFG